MRDHEDTVWYNRKAIAVRNADELIGICKGVIADKKVCQSEAEFLLDWMRTNEEMLNTFPANIVYPRLVEMLQDGELDAEEAEELLQILRNISGNIGQATADDCTIEGIYDDPKPSIKVEDSFFCLTGTFVTGKRKDIEEKITNCGGYIKKSVPKRENCILVVGTIATKDWLHSTYGKKIQNAVEIREERHSVCIITEEHLFSVLNTL